MAKATFINPFDKGVSYKDFLKSIPKGVDVESHCKGHLKKDELNWIIQELEHFKFNNKEIETAEPESIKEEK